MSDKSTGQVIQVRAKHGKAKPRARIALKNEEYEWRNAPLIAWPRGFTQEDAPPDLRNFSAPK